MTGLESNLEALAEKEYRQDEARLSFYEKAIKHCIEQKRKWEQEQQEYTDKILDIQRKRIGSHEQR